MRSVTIRCAPFSFPHSHDHSRSPARQNRGRGPILINPGAGSKRAGSAAGWREQPISHRQRSLVSNETRRPEPLFKKTAKCGPVLGAAPVLQFTYSYMAAFLCRYPGFFFVCKFVIVHVLARREKRNHNTRYPPANCAVYATKSMLIQRTIPALIQNGTHCNNRDSTKYIGITAATNRP